MNIELFNKIIKDCNRIIDEDRGEEDGYYVFFEGVRETLQFIIDLSNGADEDKRVKEFMSNWD